MNQFSYHPKNGNSQVISGEISDAVKLNVESIAMSNFARGMALTAICFNCCILARLITDYPVNPIIILVVITIIWLILLLIYATSNIKLAQKQLYALLSQQQNTDPHIDRVISTES